jgi:4-hydroxy-tetrahydrodipicolinate synthase
VQVDFSKGRRIMSAMLPLMNFLDEGKFVQKIKHGCERTGLSAGKPRLPLLPLDAEEEAGLAADYIRSLARCAPAVRDEPVLP